MATCQFIKLTYKINIPDQNKKTPAISTGVFESNL